MAEEQKIESLITRITLSGDEFGRLAEKFKNKTGRERSLSLWQDTWSQVHVQFASTQNLHADLSALVSQADRDKHKYFKEEQWKGIVFNFEQVDDFIAGKIDSIYKVREASQEAERSFQASSPYHRTLPSFESTSALRLPRLDIKPFDGSYDNWQSFFDSFKSGIDFHPLSKAGTLKIITTRRSSHTLECSKSYGSKLPSCSRDTSFSL